MNAQHIYLAKKNKIRLSDGKGTTNVAIIATFCKNLETLGYTLSHKLFEALQNQSEQQVTEIYINLLPDLKKLKGAHRRFRPMYPNFPAQVMSTSECELYVNAMLHYWSAWIHDSFNNSAEEKSELFLPDYEVEVRNPLADKLKSNQVIELGDDTDFYNIFTSLAGSNSSISETDMEILKWFTTEPSIVRFLPQNIPQKEILASLAAWMNSSEFNSKYIKTATDVLRMAVVMSGGDVSLAEKTKFIKFKRTVRRNMLSLLESTGSSLTEDMLRHKSAWKRLGEILHPGEYGTRFPKTLESFKILRNNIAYYTHTSLIEQAIVKRDIVTAVTLLRERPGSFARRLDHLLRLQYYKNPELLDVDSCMWIVDNFIEVAHEAATSLLIQVFHHFALRKCDRTRYFFPKGSVSKIQVAEKQLLDLPLELTVTVVNRIRSVLIKRFSAMPALGSCYIDEALANHIIPFGQRNASKALRTIARGSRVALPEGDCVRFFLWWKEGSERADIDLGCTLLDEFYNPLSTLAYYQLRQEGWGAHSGDITSAPNGACEFIDINIDALKLSYKKNATLPRYLVMQLYSYTNQPYCDLPECFAGWMMREFPNSGEIFDPKTVVDKVDITANTTVCVPVIIDIHTREMVWSDISLKTLALINNHNSSKANISKMAKAICEMNRPSLYDLFLMHAEARGQLIGDKSKADTVFSLYEGMTPYENDRIKNEFLA